MDVWEDTTLGNSSVGEEVGELLIISDGEEDESWGNSLSSVVFGGVSGELKDLSAEVLEDRGHVDRGTASDALGVAALLQVAGHTADRELQSGLGRARGALSLLLAAASFSFSRHDL